MGIEFVMDETTYGNIVNFVYGDSQRWADILKDRFQPVHSMRTTSRDLHYFLQRGIRGSFERIFFLAKASIPAAIKALRAGSLWLQGYNLRLKRSVSPS